MSYKVNNCIKVWRAKLDITQQELAQKVLVSRKTISTLERGVYMPSVGLALKLAELFDTKVEEIFTLDDKT
ncbi:MULTISPECIES: helix-turn-helix transcriptional regulator [Thalassotalea]|uniref:helix-turn-helix transcriptional regulator n=1 Tax=Thalassotalea TaxID=1518149 RepID=UPI000943F2F6|nr:MULTISPECIES: helix-turn-helix transcriptional regulator [Thalassotalea]OKY26915.1 transcriptional regulator [Thalassotalea sp. PP2-459]